MDLVCAIQLYINKMIEDAGPGIKTLLMDKETVCLIIDVEANFSNFILIHLDQFLESCVCTFRNAKERDLSV